MAKLTVITGCMGSGKTTQLIRDTRDLYDSSMTYLVAKPMTDIRGAVNSVTSRGGWSEFCFLIPDKGFGDWAYSVKNNPVDIVFVDEAQFFETDSFLVGMTALMDSRDINEVRVYGLNTDFAGREFGALGTAMALADEVIHLKATCASCGGTATRTHRLSDSMEQIVVGGDDMYEALCWKCWDNG